MKRRQHFLPASCAALVALFAAELNQATLAAAEPKPGSGGQVVPLIVIEEVPLYDAVRNLALQMDMNFIFDPRVPGSGFEPGKSLPHPDIFIRKQDCTVAFVLGVVLKEHKLKLETNAATRVTCVVPEADPAPSMPDPALLEDTNKPISRLVIDELPLQEAMEAVARYAHLKLSFDAGFSQSTFSDRDSLVLIRWKKITARQALGALCENYGLELREDPSTATARVSVRPRHRGRGADSRR